MNHASTFLIVTTAALLLACGKSEDLPAPATQPPAAEIPQAAAAPEPVAPVVDTPLVESAPAVQPEIAIEQTAAESKPAPAPAPATPAPKPASATAAEVPAPSTPAPDLAHGQQIYRQACAFCHDKGVAGAPKIGDVATWSPRLAQGMEALHVAALRGKGAMPAKGGNPSLSDADVIAAVDYLVAQSR
ncbi:MAG: c-type cytochrome [Gammaproteobacteria bacterium]|nr:c-type cytochrome [Gammaproteobacteria bacterium]